MGGENVVSMYLTLHSLPVLCDSIQYIGRWKEKGILTRNLKYFIEVEFTYSQFTFLNCILCVLTNIDTSKNIVPIVVQKMSIILVFPHSLTGSPPLPSQQPIAYFQHHESVFLSFSFCKWNHVTYIFVFGFLCSLCF